MKTSDGEESFVPFDQGFASELIHYVILQKPVMRLTDGGNAEFTLQMTVKGNNVWWADATDALANSLAKTHN